MAVIDGVAAPKGENWQAVLHRNGKRFVACPRIAVKANGRLGHGVICATLAGLKRLYSPRQQDKDGPPDAGVQIHIRVWRERL